MTDKEFREQYKPLQVPAHFDENAPIAEQTLYALAQIGTASAAEIINKLKELHGKDAGKDIIAEVYAILTDWHTKGLIAAKDDDGGLLYNLKKITEANDGNVGAGFPEHGHD